MSSMLDMFRNIKEDDLFGSIIPMQSNHYTSKSKAKGAYAETVDAWKTKVVKDFYEYGIGLNESIAKIAESNNLNNEQILRIIEETNSEIYLNEYEKLKNKTIRNVEFEIASLEKVKDILDNDAIANQEVRTEPGDDGKEPMMKKKANFEDIGESCGDNLNFLNYSPYQIGSFSAEKQISERELLEKKAANKLFSMTESLREDIAKYAYDLSSFSGALIGYEKRGFDARDIFQKVCEDSSLKKIYQQPIIEATIKKVAEYKEFKRLPQNFELDLTSVDFLEKKATLSLGKHSLASPKSENISNSNKELPTIEIDGAMIKGYQDLIRAAQNIQKQHDKIQSDSEKIKKIEQI